MFRNTMPRYELLSQEAMATLDGGWRRLVSQIGVEFGSAQALELFRAAGQKVEDANVRFDPDFVLEQVAEAPREFDSRPANPARSVHLGGDEMVFSGVHGPPFVREGEVRRDATMEDLRNLTRLAQAFDGLDSAGGVICEPNDAPLDSRHLDMVFALQTPTDKIYMGNVLSGENARDTIAMTEIPFGGRQAIETTPATISLINCNSPLRWDDRILDAQVAHSAANRAVVLTPFLLMGAMSPVSIPATLAQQMAEALTGIALSQLIRPGCPVVFGSFLVEHRHGVRRPPVRHGGVGDRSVVHRADRAALRSAGVLRRWPDLLAGPRRPGRLRVADDDAADVPGRDQLGDAHRRLARRRARGLLREVRGGHADPGDAADRVHPAGDQRGVAGLRADEEVGHGGHFLGAAHTMERFRTCFSRPFLSSSDNHERWTRRGAKDTAARATDVRRQRLADYVEPPLDPAIRAELAAYVRRRRAELGD